MQVQTPQSLHINPHEHTDNDDDITTLITLLDQYHHHYLDISNQPLPSFHHFNNLIQNDNQTEIENFYDQFKNLKKMLNELFQKCLIILPQINKQIIENKNKSYLIQQQLYDTQLIIQSLKQKQKLNQTHLTEINILLEKSKFDYAQLHQKMNLKQQQFENQSSQIRKTFMEVTQSNEAQKKILQSLYENNQKLSNDYTELKNQKKQLQAELFKVSLQLSKSQTKIKSLENDLIKKQQLLKQYEQQIESIQQSNRKKSTNSMQSNPNEQDDMYIRSSFHENYNDKKQDKIKLGEDLYNYKAPSVKQLNGSFIMGTGIKRSLGDESDFTQNQEPLQITQITIQNQNNKPNKITDPYFSHYILISQSVKIKQDCQDMLSIDMKPFYQEIIDKRIPMHLWDQWIKNRLRQLLRKNESNE